MQIIKCTYNNSWVFTFELIFVCYFFKKWYTDSETCKESKWIFLLEEKNMDKFKSFLLISDATWKISSWYSIFLENLAYSYQIILEPFPFDLLLNLFSLLSASGSKSDLAELLEIESRIE